MTIKCGAWALHAGKLYRFTLRTCNSCCLSTVTVVMRTRLNLTFIRTLSVLLRSQVQSDYKKLNVAVHVMFVAMAMS